ncbi:MAG: helix-turn-helix domain-containing protein [Candidatus Aquicultor sp.]|nr:helix-turn-helix domain-containing protein [Candidatus Aquicultor sp.]
MNIEYDREADAAYFRLMKQKPARSIEISKYVIVDVDSDGRPVGIEVLFASKTLQDFTPWLSLSEAAEYLGFSEVTLRRWIKAKKIPTYKIGRAYRFKKEDLDRFIEKHRISA